MGWFSWLFGKEKGPPEPLVLGAKLRCPYGSQDSYLYVDSVGIDVNNLPKACVEDCKALHNIGSFGDCYAGGPCEKSMVLDEKWENPEPQGEKINGKEIITTKSLLSCRASGMEFKIINSGQDGIFAKQIILMQEMDEKYPGLREILDNPYGSLYLNEGKYELALQFIEDRMIKNGGKIELYTLYDKNNLEGEYIKGALGRLMPYCDTGALESLLNGMENSASKNKMDANADWDAHVINAEMIKLLKKDCKETKEQIETKPFYKWQEENKLFLSVAAEGVTNFAYGTLMYYSAMGSTGNTQSKGNKPAVKEKNGGSGTKGAGDAVKGGSKIADDIVKQGQKALNNFDINSSYVKPKHLSSSGGKGAKFLGDTKEAAEVILKDAMSNGKVQSIADNGLTKMGQQSYQIVIDAGKEVGTKGETLIKIVISEDGGMLSAYPVK